MPDDPLRTPLSEWDRATLDELVGRRESEHLELKGSDLDIRSRDGRKSIAREISGMISASGGFVVVGSVSGEDVVLAFPGISAGEEDVDALRRSVLDRVRPYPVVVRGPVAVEADDPGKVVLVLQVFRHPNGLPSSSDGQFWMRQGDETKPMSYDEVKARIEAASSSIRPAADIAALRLASVREPIDTYMSRELAQRGRLDVEYSALAVAVVPMAALVDLGLTGAELESALGRASHQDHQAWMSAAGEDDALFDSSGLGVVRPSGLDLDFSPFRRVTITHDGVVSVAHNVVYPAPWDEGAAVNPQLTEVAVVRTVATAASLIHLLSGPSEVYVEIRSGSIPGIVRGAERIPHTVHSGGGEAVHSFVTYSVGEPAASTISAGGTIFGTRLSDAAEFNRGHRSDSRIADYLAAMFND